MTNQPNHSTEREERDNAPANQHTPANPLDTPATDQQADVYELHGEQIVDQYLFLESESGAKLFRIENNERTKKAIEDARFEEICKHLELKNIPDDRVLPAFEKNIVIRVKSTQDKPKGEILIASREDFMENREATEYETLLDIGALAETEDSDWFISRLVVKPEKEDRILIGLSDGGGDAILLREFDIKTRSFIKGGFSQKGRVFAQYEGGSNALWFAASTSENTSSAGLPLEVKRWDRSTPLEKAPVTFTADPKSMSAQPIRIEIQDNEYLMGVLEQVDFHHQRWFLFNKKNEQLELPLPKEHSILAIREGVILFKPEEKYLLGDVDYKDGIVALNLRKFPEIHFIPISQALEEKSIIDAEIFGDTIYLCLTENVCSRLFRVKQTVGDLFSPQAPRSVDLTEINLPDNGTVHGITSIQDWGVVISYSNFVTPPSQFLLTPDNDQLGDQIFQPDHKFNSEHVEVSQCWATSEDKTKIPYFVVDGRHDKERPAKTILHGYGGFGSSLTPHYNWPAGATWLEQGGILVYANIRGGGEFGPEWHKAAIGKNRPRAYEDFKAVADALVGEELTTNSLLGAEGGSNGGLLVGNMLTRYPGTFGCIVCAVPLLDMLRYDHFEPGKMWRAEYGSTDEKNDIPHLKDMSPYHNVDPQKNYPPVLFLTRTSDDRVHPSHARKMAAKMQGLAKMQGRGIDNVYFFEEDAGGHSSGDFNSWIRKEARMVRFFEKFLEEPKE